MVYQYPPPLKRGIFSLPIGVYGSLAPNGAYRGAQPSNALALRKPQGGTAADVSPDGVPRSDHPKLHFGWFFITTESPDPDSPCRKLNFSAEITKAAGMPYRTGLAANIRILRRYAYTHIDTHRLAFGSVQIKAGILHCFWFTPRSRSRRSTRTFHLFHIHKLHLTLKNV